MPTRRRTLQGLLIAASSGSLMPLALGQAPAPRSYKVIVGSPPGTLGDVLARLFAQRLSEASGQPGLADNRPGASGAIAADLVARAPADGGTLLLAPDSVMVVNPFVFSKLPYDPTKDFQPVALLGKATLLLVASPKLNVKTMAEFVRLVKSQPKVINFGTGGPGHATHVTMELLRNRLGLDLTHVPYKGTAPALQALMTGEIGCMMTGVAESIALIRAGNIVPLAVSGPAARETFPDLPQMKDLHADLDMTVWFAMFAPAATPAGTVAMLNAELNKSLQHADVKKRLADFGLTPTPGSIADLDALMKADRARFGPLVKSLGIVVE